MASITSQSGAQIQSQAVASGPVDPATLLDRDAVFVALSEHRITVEQAKARMAELVQPAFGQTITLKVSQRGAISVYGLGRRPITAYRGQWLAFERSGHIVLGKSFREFLAKNDHLIADKADAVAVQIDKLNRRKAAGIVADKEYAEILAEISA